MTWVALVAVSEGVEALELLQAERPRAAMERAATATRRRRWARGRGTDHLSNGPRRTRPSKASITFIRA
jgi:hypothetical protein